MKEEDQVDRARALALLGRLVQAWLGEKMAEDRWLKQASKAVDMAIADRGGAMPGAVAMSSAELEDLVDRAVQNACTDGREPWVNIKRVFAVGSTRAVALCRHYGRDPYTAKRIEKGRAKSSLDSALLATVARMLRARGLPWSMAILGSEDGRGYEVVWGHEEHTYSISVNDKGVIHARAYGDLHWETVESVEVLGLWMDERVKEEETS